MNPNALPTITLIPFPEGPVLDLITKRNGKVGMAQSSVETHCDSAHSAWQSGPGDLQRMDRVPRSEPALGQAVSPSFAGLGDGNEGHLAFVSVAGDPGCLSPS